MAARPALTLFCAVALRGAIENAILPAFTQDTGTLVDAHFAPTRILIQEITAGARPDVIIGITAALEGLDDGILDGGPLTPIAKAGIGVAVAPDAEIPDIASVEKLTGALTAARSVAYSRNGPSGIYFAKLLQDLGIAGTGTASDAVCLVCPPDGRTHHFGGPRSAWGARLARATHAAIVAGGRYGAYANGPGR